MARLSFQNVPTSTGGVVSGNISTGAGSPFGAGGKYETQIAGIKTEIAKKPKGYYDPQESFNIQSYSIDEILRLEIPIGQRNFETQFENQLTYGLNKAYGDAPSGKNKDRLKRELDAERQRLKDVQLNAHMNGVLARLQNGELVAPDYFQRDIIRAQSGISSPTEFLTVYQSMVKKGIIHQKIIVEKPIPVIIASTTPEPEPTPEPEQTPKRPTPTGPAITTSPTSYLPLAVVGIVIVVILLFLRRRA